MKASTNVDYVNLTSDRRSILGYCTFCVGTLLLKGVRIKAWLID